MISESKRVRLSENSSYVNGGEFPSSMSPSSVHSSSSSYSHSVETSQCDRGSPEKKGEDEKIPDCSSLRQSNADIKTETDLSHRSDDVNEMEQEASVTSEDNGFAEPDDSPDQSIGSRLDLINLFIFDMLICRNY